MIRASQHPCEVGNFVKPILQKKGKPRHCMIMWFGHVYLTNYKSMGGNKEKETKDQSVLAPSPRY